MPITKDSRTQVTISLPNYVVQISQTLLRNNFKAYLVGGALRDTLLNLNPDDYDIATNALPSQIQKTFPQSKEVGAKFGTVIVPVYIPAYKKYANIEITTFRTESDYKDYRHPSKVTFITDITNDLARRDFTINAMAADLSVVKDITPLTDPSKNITLTLPLIDPYNGIEDLSTKTIRAVGNPLERFKEDPLRAFRACRFRAQLEFDIEPKTYNAIPRILDLIKYISKERLQSELVKLLTYANKPSLGIECMRKTGLLKYLIPELLDTVGVEQPIMHKYDVYTHLLKACDNALKKLEVRLAALLHDIAKPFTKTPDGHFYGHDKLSAQMAEKILKRLRFPNKTIKHVVTLIRWHMFYYPNYIEELEHKQPPSKWSDAAVRRFIQRVGLEYIEDLFQLRIADAKAISPKVDPYPEINALHKHIQKVLQQEAALKISDLKINGNDIIQHLNLKPGPVIGEILRYLLERVIEDPTLNKKNILIKLAKEYLQKNPKSTN